jgi:hypothetical protein
MIVLVRKRIQLMPLKASAALQLLQEESLAALLKGK